jgi:hypothetical protein
LKQKDNALVARSISHAAILHAYNSKARSRRPCITLAAREFRELAGSNAEIYQTTYNGALAFAPPSQSQTEPLKHSKRRNNSK